MALDLIPRSFWNLPTRLPSIFDEDDGLFSMLPSSGLSVSEDNQNIYIEAAVPGVEPDQVEVTYDKGIAWIKGAKEEKEEDKQRKFYRKASGSFSYRVSVPGNIDPNQEPTAVIKNGTIRLTFKKQPEEQPKRIQITKE
jgi:HSP20 family protein